MATQAKVDQFVRENSLNEKASEDAKALLSGRDAKFYEVMSSDGKLTLKRNEVMTYIVSVKLTSQSDLFLVESVYCDCASFRFGDKAKAKTFAASGGASAAKYSGDVAPVKKMLCKHLILLLLRYRETL